MHIDVIGVVKEVGELGSITSQKTSKTIPKRELTLVDRTGYSVRLTLWGKQAEEWSAFDTPIIAVKGAKVGDFGGAPFLAFSRALCADLRKTQGARFQCTAHPRWR